MKKLSVLLLPLFFALCVYSVHAQVSITPTAVFLDSNSKIASMYIANPASEAVEVQLSFEFAYPDSDDDGRVSLNYDDPEAEERYSLQPYLRAFPNTFVLQPNQRQTIRLLARMPNDLPDATYWTRMRISSSQLSPPIGEVAGDVVSAQVGFQIDQVIAVLVHHGDVNTGLTIHGVETDQSEDDRLVIRTDVERSGNAPFIGSLHTRIFDTNDNLVAEKQTPLSIYFQNTRRVEFDTNGWESGQYTAEITFESSRNDVRSQHLNQIDPVTETVSVTID